MSTPGATILDADGLRLTADERAFFREADPWGFILFARNIDSADQLRALCAEMREVVGRDAPILIDQEGGRVQRLVPPLARQWRAPLDHVTAAGQGAVRATSLRYRLIAHELRDLGIDVDCAPLADLALPETHPFLKTRCFGAEPGRVALLARACADGLLAGGVLPIVKHIPGHGRATADSHETLPVVRTDLETLNRTDFAAFRTISDLPMAMTAHVVYTAISEKPATLSPEVMGMIRTRIGFGGLVMTDDLGMKALSGPLPDLTRQALDAGCDVILHCNGTLAERAQVAEAAGRLTEAAAERAKAALAWRRAPDPIDIRAAEEELDRLMGGQVYGG